MPSFVTRFIGAVLILPLLCGPEAWAGDGVIEINQARALAGEVSAGDAAGFPVTVSQAGSYRLTGNLNLTDPNEHAIEVTADNVTLDLNGFTIAGPGLTSGSGIGIFAFGRTNLTIQNGSVTAMASFGVRLGNQARVENVRISNNSVGLETGVDSWIAGVASTHNRLTGIQMVGDSVVVNSVVSENAGDGINGGARCLILGNLVNDNGDEGIVVGDDSTVLQNNVSQNASFGLTLESRTGFGLNVLTINNGSNSNPQVSGGGIEVASNVCGTDTVCP